MDSIEKDTKCINDYIAAVNGGSSVTDAFSKYMLSASDVAKDYAQNTNFASLSAEEFEKNQRVSGIALAAQNKSLGSCKGLIAEYNSALTSTDGITETAGLTTEEFANAVGKSNAGLGNYLSGLNGAQASMSGYITSIASATLKTVALQAATIALNAAISFGISAAISLGISAIDNYIHRMDNAIEKAADAKGELESLSSEISSLKSQISDLDNQKASITDESELAELEAQSAELERQLALKEALQKSAQSTSTSAAENALSMKGFSVEDGTRAMYDASTGTSYETTNYRSADIIEYTRQQYDQLQKTKEQLEQAKADLNELLSQEDLDISEGDLFGFGAGKDYAAYTNLTSQIEHLETQYDSLNSSVAENTQTIEDNYETLSENSENLTDEQQTLADRALDFLNEFVTGSEEVVDATEDVAEAASSVVDDISSAAEAAATTSNALIEGITNAQAALSAQSTGQSISLDDYSELSGYGEALEYVNGAYQLNAEKVRELTKAKADEQIAINDANKALAQ